MIYAMAEFEPIKLWDDNSQLLLRIELNQSQTLQGEIFNYYKYLRTQ